MYYTCIHSYKFISQLTISAPDFTQSRWTGGQDVLPENPVVRTSALGCG